MYASLILILLFKINLIFTKILAIPIALRWLNHSALKSTVTMMSTTSFVDDLRYLILISIAAYNILTK